MLWWMIIFSTLCCLPALPLSGNANPQPPSVPVRAREEQETSWAPPGSRGLALWVCVSEDAGAELTARASGSLSCSPGKEGVVRNMSCPRSEGHWVKEGVSSSLGSGLLSPTFSCPSPSLSPDFYCLSPDFHSNKGIKFTLWPLGA